MAQQRRQRPTGRELQGERVTGRIARRVRVMAAFSSCPGELLETDQVAAITHLPPSLVRSIVASLEADRWLQRGRSSHDHQAWRRATDNNGDGDQPPAAPVVDRPPPARRGDRYFCRHCRATAEGPEPPAGWWRLQHRQPGYTGRVFSTSGLYCSIGCVAADTASAADRE